MDKERYLLFVVFVCSFFVPALAGAQVFNVSNPAEFQNDLSTAQTNDQDDVINVLDDMTITATLTYYGESGHTLTINGNGHSLDGGNSTQIMNIHIIIGSRSHITIQYLTFQNGNTETNGGGLYVHTSSADITLQGCTFSGNSAGRWGGGAHVSTALGTATLTNNTFTRNSAHYLGGGVNVDTHSGTATLTNNTFSGNSANNGGGVNVYADGGTAILINNTFTGNSASDLDGGGAEVGIISGTATLKNNIFRENSSDRYGGGAKVEERMVIGSSVSLITITNNLFIRNSAGKAGGGLRASVLDGTATLTNNTFTGNSARWGGGADVRTSGGSATLTNNTFSGNSADYNGGGIWVGTRYDQATANIYNNIIWGNTASDYGDDLNVYSDADQNGVGSTINLYNNDLGPNSDFTTGRSEDLWISVTDNYHHVGNIKADPMFVDPASGNFHLHAVSPCIDAGENGAPSIPDKDYEGNDRVIDGDNDGDAVVDMGADEYTSSTKGDVNGDGQINIVDALLTARYAVGLPVSNFNTDAADVNCDGDINIVDALFIARKAVGLPVPGWCGG